MENVSERLISLEEAKTALKCMRLGGLNEEEAVESLDSVCERVRKVTISKLVEDIIENRLSAVQRDYIKKYWYAQAQILKINREKADGLVKGCICTVSQIKENWGKIPSGWICLDYCRRM